VTVERLSSGEVRNTFFFLVNSCVSYCSLYNADCSACRKGIFVAAFVDHSSFVSDSVAYYCELLRGMLGMLRKSCDYINTFILYLTLSTSSCTAGIASVVTHGSFCHFHRHLWMKSEGD